MTDAFEIVWYNGKRMDKKTRAFVQAMEERLGYNVTITQGCYNPGGVKQSAGTHDLGGVLDLPSNDRDRKMKVIKDLGGWGWYRPAIKGLWGPHIHFGITDHGNLARGAANQQKLYFAGRSGLKSNAADKTYRAPGRPVFKYPVPVKVVVPEPTRVSRARDELTVSLHEALQAYTLLLNAPKSRTDVWEQVHELKKHIRGMRSVLEGLPKR